MINKYTTQKILLVGANGYIGCRFLERCKDKYNIYSIDNLLKKNDLLPNINQIDYREMKINEINEFDICLWLAGHSSVPQSLADPEGCYDNNYSGLVNFMNMFKGKIIYASSASVYTSIAGAICDEDTTVGMPINIYDYTKISIDNYMSIMNKDFVSLRFGTVDGGSKHIREELLLNKMVKDALNENKIYLANPKANRGVLFIEDLVDAIELLLNSPPKLPQIYNLSSINANMETLANIVKKKTNATIHELDHSSKYNFQMSSNKFSNDYNYHFTDDVEVIIDNLIKFYT